MNGVPGVDPKNLIREAYRIEGVSAEECRSIFLDWALSLGPDILPETAIEHLLAQYGKNTPDHPMTKILTEGLQTSPGPKRRGGWRSRPRNT